MAIGPHELLLQRLRSDPASPVITFYDDDTGERIELSTTTFANWVAKTSGLLSDLFNLELGDRVAVHLPNHWLLPVWLHACWHFGALADLGGDPAASALTIASPSSLQECLGAPEVVLCSLLPLAMPSRDPLPVGVHDYSVEVRAMPDAFTRPPVAAEMAAVVINGVTVTGIELVAQARGLRGEGERVLVEGPLRSIDDIVAAAVAPLSPGGSAVLSALPWPQGDPRIDQERVTHRWGPSGQA